MCYLKSGKNEFVVSPFERSLNTTSASEGSPKSPELDDHQSTINNLVKQLNSSKGEIDSLKEQIAVFTEFKMPYKLNQAAL